MASSFAFSYQASDCEKFPASSDDGVIQGLKDFLSAGRADFGWVSFEIDKKKMSPGDKNVLNGGSLLLLELNDRYSVSFQPDKFDETPDYTVSWNRLGDGTDVITFNGPIIAFDNFADNAEPGKRARVYCDGTVTMTIDP